ncbi:MAG: hypothetical protein ACLQFR_17340 [Streptosporangiaceae bacterium]
MSGQEIPGILEEALEDAGLTEGERTRVMVCFALAWGRHLQRDLDNAIFTEMISEEQGQ